MKQVELAGLNEARHPIPMCTRLTLLARPLFFLPLVLTIPDESYCCTTQNSSVEQIVSRCKHVTITFKVNLVERMNTL